jgi:FkbM family methyltransferase
MLIRIKKLVEYRITYLIAILSPKLAKKFSFRKENNLNFLNINSKCLEAELLLLPYFLYKGFNFIDVGANRGLYCFYVEKIINQESIIAFEPVPSLSKLLKKVFPRIRVVEKALSNDIGTSTLNIPLHQKNYLMDTRSTLEISSRDFKNGLEKIPVETTTLDDFLRNQKNLKVSLIKIDVEGHEIKVISGAKRSLSINKPFMIVEIEERHHIETFNEVFTLIDQLGYAIYYFDTKFFRLKLAFDPIEHLIKSEVNRSLIHNYICIPIEKDSIVESINKSIGRAFDEQFKS